MFTESDIKIWEDFQTATPVPLRSIEKDESKSVSKGEDVEQKEYKQKRNLSISHSEFRDLELGHSESLDELGRK